MSSGEDGIPRRDVAQLFQGVMRGLRDVLPENWPSSQATVAIVVFVAVLCAFAYGLLRDAEPASLTYTADSPVAYFRVASRSSTPAREPGYVELAAILHTPVIVTERPAPR
ncbi:hypothetical protein HPB50_014888 [Hyalomma asiaticum]|uniref:Uncharacterized protein n=1 Tax=Hyalomma asiaticum TaxID=266040 RepID=A0ACB7T2V0_HYAAI|nr:hypothetical protein HPB50_014888 [Hyalomma asiaticum]